MKAMVLAAGLGTRLRPLTNDRPKALVEVGGRTLLQICISRLSRFGIDEIIVNAHHFAPKVVEYLKKANGFGMRIEVSEEEILLDTGGGLKKAAWFFGENAVEKPFLVHNVDVVSTLDLQRLVQFHHENGALATLAVQARAGSRQLLFDENGLLCGRRAEAVEWARRCANATPLAFCGIHAISPKIFSRLTEDGAFPIIPAYLRLAAQGEKILAFRADDCHWRDLGTMESLRAAEKEQWIVNSGS